MLRVQRRGVRLGEEARQPAVGQHVPHDREHRRRAEEDQRQPLHHRLPRPHASSGGKIFGDVHKNILSNNPKPVVQHEEADGEAGQGAAEVAHEARTVVGVIEADVDSEADVVRREQQDEDDADDLGERLPDHLLDAEVVVLAPVEGHGGEVRGDEGVDAAAGPRQVGGAVGEAGAEAARRHARHVHSEHLHSRHMRPGHHRPAHGVVTFKLPSQPACSISRDTPTIIWNKIYHLEWTRIITKQFRDETIMHSIVQTNEQKQM